MFNEQLFLPFSPRNSSKFEHFIKIEFAERKFLDKLCQYVASTRPLCKFQLRQQINCSINHLQAPRKAVQGKLLRKSMKWKPEPIWGVHRMKGFFHPKINRAKQPPGTVSNWLIYLPLVVLPRLVKNWFLKRVAHMKLAKEWTCVSNSDKGLCKYERNEVASEGETKID